MTPNDCLLGAICFVSASLLIRVAEPVLEYSLAGIVILLWMSFGVLFPFILLFLSLGAALGLAQVIYVDTESIQWKLTATSAIMLTMTVVLCGVRLLWRYFQTYYGWMPDMEKLAMAMAGVIRVGVQSCIICAVILTLLGCWVELFQEPMFGIHPLPRVAEPEPQEINDASSTQSEIAGNTNV